MVEVARRTRRLKRFIPWANTSPSFAAEDDCKLGLEAGTPEGIHLICRVKPVDTTFTAFAASGAVTHMAPTNQPYGHRIPVVEDSKSKGYAPEVPPVTANKCCTNRWARAFIVMSLAQA